VRLVVLYLLVRGIVPRGTELSVRSPILRARLHASSPIPAALVLLRPNRAHLWLPCVLPHPRRQLFRLDSP
jgi:hypothetical protein